MIIVDHVRTFLFGWYVSLRLSPFFFCVDFFQVGIWLQLAEDGTASGGANTNQRDVVEIYLRALLRLHAGHARNPAVAAAARHHVWSHTSTITPTHPHTHTRMMDLFI